MALTPLSQAIYKGLDPGVYQPLQQLETGDALTQAGMDASPTSKWGALGRVAQALSGSYLTNTSRSKLADTIAGGKKQALDDLMAALQPQAAVPSGAPQSAAPRSMAMAPTGQPMPAVQPAPPEGSPAAIVADRFPAEWSPKSAKEQVAERFPAEWSPQTAAAPADAGPVAAIDRATQPRGIRNNNPLNIEDGPFAKSMPGYVGSDGRFAKFETQDHGLGAANTLLDTYERKHGLNTVSGILNRWAPASDGNNVSAYAEDVSKRIGLDPNAPVPRELRPALIAAMGHHENGVPVTGGAQSAQALAPVVASDAEGASGGKPVRMAQAASNTATDASNGLDAHRLLAVLNNPYADDTAKALAGKLLFQQLTPKEDEFASSPQGIYNKRTGELKQGQNAGNDFGDLRGKDLLTSLEKSDPASAAQVKAIIEGRTAYPTGSRLNPVQQRVKELVTLVDPTFETGNSGARMKVRNEFMAGGPNTPAGQITAGNTAIQHLGHLLEASDTLGGASNWGPLNSPINHANVKIKGSSNDEGLVKYNNALGRFAEEATKFYRGVGGTEADIQRALEDLTAAQSPEARRAAIKAQADLMHSKVNALQDRWKQGMGPLVDEFPIIHPESKQALEKINPPAGGVSEKKGATPAAPAAPKAISSKAEYDALPSGATYVAPDGSTRTKK